MARRKWIRWALIASVTLNLLVLGAVVGAIVSGGPRGERVARGGPPEMAALFRALNGPERRAILRGLRQDGVLREGRAHMRARQVAILETLQADPFDRTAFEAALAGQQSARAELATRGIARVADVIEAMAAEERAALAQRMAERGARRE